MNESNLRMIWKARSITETLTAFTQNKSIPSHGNEHHEDSGQGISSGPHPLDNDEQKDDEKNESMNVLSEAPNVVTASSQKDILNGFVSRKEVEVIPLPNAKTQDAIPEFEQKMSMTNIQSKRQDIHRICYCQRDLIEYNDMDEDEGWRCHSCCRLIHESSNFWCDAGEECIYEKISDSPYVVCRECYDTEIETEFEQKEKELVDEDSIQNIVIIDKIEASLKRIS